MASRRDYQANIYVSSPPVGPVDHQIPMTKRTQPPVGDNSPLLKTGGMGYAYAANHSSSNFMSARDFELPSAPV